MATNTSTKWTSFFAGTYNEFKAKYNETKSITWEETSSKNSWFNRILDSFLFITTRHKELLKDSKGECGFYIYRIEEVNEKTGEIEFKYIGFEEAFAPRVTEEI